MTMITAPDISHFHPVRNWKLFKKNAPFAISKATQGLGGKKYSVDPTLHSFIKGCEAYHIPYYLYTFLERGNELGQAKFLVKTCEPLVGEYFRGYVLDVEPYRGTSPSVTGVKKALEYINGKSYKTMLYTMYSQYSRYRSVIETRGARCAWWEARYGRNDGKYRKSGNCHKGVDLHQYTSKGYCGGVSRGDMNRLTGTKPLTWFTAGKPRTVKAKAKKAVKTVKSKVVKYSTHHVYPVLPPRGYYKEGDGYKTLTDYTTQLKRVQALCNFAGFTCGIDGDYGPATRNAVIKLQKKLGLTPDGKFGHNTLEAAKAKYK